MNYSDIILPDNPFALFRLNESRGSIVQDFQSGIILTLSSLVTGSIGYQQPALINDIDTSLHFDESGVRGIVPLDYSLPHTIEGWFKSDNPVSNEQIIYSNYFDSSDWSYQLVAVTFGGQIQLKINTNIGVVTLSATGIIFTDGENYYFSITFDGNNVILYINGIPRATVSNVSILNTQNDAFTLANYYTITEVNSFSGWIDEVGVYQYPLSMTLVDNHYQAGIHVNDPTTGFFDAAIASGPVAYYRMGDVAGSTTLVDEIGSATATLVGPVTLGVPGALVGDSDTALSLSDNTQWGTAQDPVLNLTTDLSIALWVNFDVIVPQGNTDTQQTMIAKRTGGTNTQTEYLLDMLGGNLRYVGSNSAVNSITDLLANLWYFIVITRTNNLGSIYINGALDSQGALNAPFTNTGAIGIGAPVDFGFGIASVRGVMDEVIFYNRALALGEIQSLYNSGITPPVIGGDNGGIFAGTINL